VPISKVENPFTKEVVEVEFAGEQPTQEELGKLYQFFAKDQRAEIVPEEDIRTKTDVAAEAISQTPGNIGGFMLGFKAFPATPNPLVTGIGKVGAGIAGSIVGGEATEAFLKDVTKGAINALTSPPEERWHFGRKR
jgi:hypothetical protein